jgi:hypothetical protein
MGEGEWFFVEGGQQAGPVSESDLRIRLLSGAVPASTLVWKDGLAEWTPADTLPEFAPPPPEPLPVVPVEAPPAPVLAPAPPAPRPAPVPSPRGAATPGAASGGARSARPAGSAPARTPYRPQPVGDLKKGMAVTSLVLGVLGLPTVALLFIGGIVGLILGIMALVRANGEPHVYGGRGMAIAGIVLNSLGLVSLPVVGIVAAIAIPSLLRGRMNANEATAIVDLRTVITGEASYAATTGAYDTVECLTVPANCISGYQGPTFLPAELAATLKAGYIREFHAGPPAVPSTGQQLSPSSMSSFAYVLVPMTRGQTGVRSFCGDSSGVICHHADGAPFAVDQGACPSDCQPIH